MDSARRFLRKLWLAVRRKQFHDDLSEEMAFHREQEEKRLRAEGMDGESAHYAAKRQFGNSAQLKERSLEMVEFRFETTMQDFRYAIRQLRKNPGFSVTAILILALGICASVAIFGFVDAALIQPLPYPDPTRLVNVTESIAMIPVANLSYLDYLDWKRLNKVFQSLDIYTDNGYMLRTSGRVELAAGARVSAGFFRTLGISPLLGRDFHDGEDTSGAAPTAILSYAAWQQRFGGRKDVIGETVTLSDTAHTIIGVLPQDFQFAPLGPAGFWTPLQPNASCERWRNCHNLEGVARLRDGVTVEAALADTTLIAKQLEQQYPDTNRGQGASVELLSEVIVGGIRPILLVLLGGAGLLLLIACVNIASLLLVRSESRRREIAIRSALGASPTRLGRQFVSEGLVLVAGGSLLGLAAATVTMQLLKRLIPPRMLAGMPFLQSLGMNRHVVAFGCTIGLLATVLFSMTPALHLPLGGTRDGLADGSRGSAGMWKRFGSKFVVVELTVATVLLAGAGLFGKSLYRLLHVELGFQPDHLATLHVSAPQNRYGKADQAIALGRKVVSRLSTVPGVKSAALTSVLPVSFNGNTAWIRFLDRPYNGGHDEVNERDVSSEYFSTLKAKLLRGRYFGDAEDESKPGVVVINESLATKYFPGADPIGKRLAHFDLAPNTTREIVGVVEDIKEGPLDSEIWPAVYYPFNQAPDSDFSVAVRTSQSEAAVLPSLIAAIHEIDSDIGTIGEATMEGKISNSQTAYLHRSSAWLVGGFAGLALVLGVVGLYGVIAYSVSRRTREIGVRMALGAESSSVYRLILKEAGSLAAFGVGLGLVCSVAAAMMIRKVLFGVEAWDASMLVAVAVTLALSALLASYLPARRAASVNPADALRAE